MPMRPSLLLLACLTTPAAAQAGDSLLIETPETRLVVHAAEWARNITLLRVRAEPT